MSDISVQSGNPTGFISVDKAELFYRRIGSGLPLIIIHGGPDFDHTYLLPDMDRLADSYLLIYYDQRCRGRSTGELSPDEINIDKFAEDLDAVISYFRLEKAAVLGHSWGAHLAIQYALRYPRRLSHLILMNTAPASYEDGLLFRDAFRRRRAPYENKLTALYESAAYEQGEPEIVAEYYKIIFGTTFSNRKDLLRLNLSWTKEDIIRGRKAEELVMRGLYWSEGFSILPLLKRLHMPTLLLHGENDHIPVKCASNIADIIPGAKLVVIKGSGHFSYIDAHEKVRNSIDEFLNSL